MTEVSIPLEKLCETFVKVVDLTYSSLTYDDKEFLLSFKAGRPKWELLPLAHIENLPAIKWKLHNIQRMTPEKHKEMLRRLEEKLA
jgi:hypothetical protein